MYKGGRAGRNSRYFIVTGAPEYFPASFYWLRGEGGRAYAFLVNNLKAVL